MLNEVALVGRLAKDPEIQKVANNKKRTSITLAVPRCYKNSEGLYDTDFIYVVLFDAIASNTTEYCKTGDLIGVKGRLQSNSYEDAEGNKKYNLEIIGEKVTFLSSNKSEKAE